MSDKITDALAQIDQPGRVTWHSSGEDEGPDVGLSFGLGNGASLYVGEMTRRLWEACPSAHALGDDAGWWLELLTPTGRTVIGKATEPEAGRALIDALSMAWKGRGLVVPFTLALQSCEAGFDAAYEIAALAEKLLSAAPTAQGQDTFDWTKRVPEPHTSGCEFTMSYADEPNSIVCRNGHMIDIDTFTEGFDESDFLHPCPKCNADAYAAWKAENGDEGEDDLPSAPSTSAGEAK